MNGQVATHRDMRHDASNKRHPSAGRMPHGERGRYRCARIQTFERRWRPRLVNGAMNMTMTIRQTRAQVHELRTPRTQKTDGRRAGTLAPCTVTKRLYRRLYGTDIEALTVTKRLYRPPCQIGCAPATVTKRLYRCDSLTAKPGPDEGPGRVSRRIHKDRILTTRRRCRCNSYPGGEPVMQLPQYAA